MTKEEFEAKYAERSNMSPAQKEAFFQTRGAVPCDCGDAICEGWQMVNIKEFQEDEAMRREMPASVSN